MKTLHTLLLRFGKDERGATALEYGVMVAMLAVVMIGGLNAIGGNQNSMYSNLYNKVPN